MNTKTMFAISALCAAVALTTSAVESDIVGYNNTSKGIYDTQTFVGASFTSVSGTEILPFNSLSCVEGFDDGDIIQVASMDNDGLLQFKDYVYWEGDGWADSDLMEVVGDDVGFTLGKAGWFVSSVPKQIVTSGAVKKSYHIHTFTDTMTCTVSAFPSAFCPNSANVAWAFSDGDGIQVPSLDEDGLVNFKEYQYWEGEGWADPDLMDLIGDDVAVVDAGKGFWIVTANPATASFTEYSPIAE